MAEEAQSVLKEDQTEIESLSEEVPEVRGDESVKDAPRKPRWTVGDQIHELFSDLHHAYDKPNATPEEKLAPFLKDANMEALVQLREHDSIGFESTLEDIIKITGLGKKVLTGYVQKAFFNLKGQQKYVHPLRDCPFAKLIQTLYGPKVVPELTYIASYLIKKFDLMAIHNENQEEGLALWIRSGNNYRQISSSDLFLIKELQTRLAEWGWDDAVDKTWIQRIEILRQAKVKTIVPPVEGMFPVANGILDIKNLVLIKDDEGKICLVRSGVVYDPEAKCPDFDKFLIDIFNGDQKKIEAFLSWLGSIIAGMNPHIIIMLKSRGRSGKDVLMQVVSGLLGGMLTTNSPNDLHKRFSNWEFLHKRVVYLDEFDAGKASPNAMKELSGGVANISFETKGVQAIMTAPVQCAIFIVTNNPPPFEKGSAWEERLKVLDFPNSYVTEPDPAKSWEKLMDAAVIARLTPELSGILNKIIPYAQHALENPTKMFKQDILYKDIEESLDRASDPLDSFIEECCELAPLIEDTYGNMKPKYKGYSVTDTTLFKKYGEYCSRPDVNVSTIKQKSVRDALKKDHRVISEGHNLIGIRLKK